MALSYIEHTGDGSTVTFPFTFDYLAPGDVKVYLDGVEEVEWSFVTTHTIELNTAPGAGVTVRIARETPREPLVDFQTTAQITESDLDTANLQTIYLAQETLDGAEDALRITLTSSPDYDADEKRITRVADPTAAQDAATKAYADSLAMAAGNVPTPSDPADDGKVLAASGGAFSWTSFVPSMLSGVVAFITTFLTAANEAAARAAIGAFGTDGGTINGAVTVDGNLDTSGTLDVTGNATVGGTLGVTGDATLGANLGVTGDATVGGTLDVVGALTEDGNRVFSQTSMFATGNQTLTAGSLHTFAHGLGGVPLVVIGELVCAVADNGWEQGDRMYFTIGGYNGSNHGAILAANADNVFIRTANELGALPKSSGASTNFTLSRWRANIRAWR